MIKQIIGIIAVLLLVGCAQKIEVNQQPVANTTANEDINSIDQGIANIDNTTDDLNTTDIDTSIDQVNIS